ncbi:hypothetical protein ACLOJK_022762 [Asimina triloba]
MTWSTYEIGSQKSSTTCIPEIPTGHCSPHPSQHRSANSWPPSWQFCQDALLSDSFSSLTQIDLVVSLRDLQMKISDGDANMVCTSTKDSAYRSSLASGTIAVVPDAVERSSFFEVPNFSKGMTEADYKIISETPVLCCLTPLLVSNGCELPGVIAFDSWDQLHLAQSMSFSDIFDRISAFDVSRINPLEEASLVIDGTLDDIAKFLTAPGLLLVQMKILTLSVRGQNPTGEKIGTCHL